MDGIDPYAEFNRAINEQIKNATNELLKSPDWGAITAICDSINQNPILCEEVSRVVKKRLVTKGPEVSLLTLTLLDALMKNCPSFHRHAAHPEFMDTIMKLLDKEKPTGLDKLFNRKLTNDEVRARIDARERTLVMIQAWARSFPRDRFPAFADTYDRLRSQGVIFPVPDKDEAAPVFTPPIRVPREAPPNRTGVEPPFTDPECRIAGDNANLLILTLTESSEKEDLKKNDLIETLIGAVRRSQATISSRLQSGQFGDQATTEDLFRVNDLLLDAVKYYDGLVSGAMERIKPKPTPSDTDSPKERRSSSISEEKDPKRKTSAAAPTGDILNIGAPSGSTSSPIRSSPKPGKQTSSPGAGGSRPETESERKVIPTLSPPPGAGKGKPKRSPSQTALDGAVSPKNSAAAAPAPVVGDILDLSSLSSAPPVASPAKKALSPRNALSPRRSQIAQAPIPVSRQPVNMLDDMFDPLGGPPAAAVSAAPARAAAQPAADEFDPFMDLATRDIKKQ